jgi:zinc protease
MVIGALTIALTAGAAVRLAAQDSFPSRPPAASPLAPVRFPSFQEITLANGMQLLVVENHEQPIVSAFLAFRAGGMYDASGKEGTAQLVAELLTKGTPTRTAAQISATIEGVGGNLSASSGADFLTVSTDVLTDHADLAFDLLGDVVRNATFPTDELELARTRYLSNLAVELSQPSNVAARFFATELYGRHPYGRNPTSESYRAVTRDDVQRFAAARLRPSGALLVITGDVSFPRAQALARKALGGWVGTPAPAVVPVPLPAHVATEIVLVHRPGSVQGNIVLGNTTFLPTDPGYYAARVATQVLGGGPDSRLFLILREQKSWTYGSYAGLDRKRGVGSFEATFEGRSEVVDSALVEMLHQIDRMRTELVPDSELTNVKGFLVGSFPLTIETPQQIASVVANARLLGLGPDYVRLYRERLAAVTRLQIRVAAVRVYHRNALTIVVVGDAEQLYDRLKAIAPVRLVDIDGKPMTLADLHPQAGPITLDRAQIVTRSDSFQVLIQERPMGAMVTRWNVTNDSISYFEDTQIAGGQVQQTTTIRLNPADLSVTTVDQTGHQGPQQAETHLTYAAGRVKGSSIAAQESGPPTTTAIDTAIAPGTYDDNAMNTVIQALPLEPGKTFNVGVFESGQNRTAVMQIKVSDGGAVTVPAGTFQTYRLDIAGGQVPIVMSVSKETPRRIVRIELIGVSFVAELVK